ncbi:MAG: glycosyltransferase [Promethearchaeota archaeon]
MKQIHPIKKIYRQFYDKYDSFRHIVNSLKKKEFNELNLIFKEKALIYQERKRIRERNKFIISNPKIYPKVGYVVSLDFHLRNKWLSAVTPYRINGIMNYFPSIVIETQKDYNKYKNKLDALITTEMGWSAPIIKYNKTKPPLKYIEMSDPQKYPRKREKYFYNNHFSYVLGYYYYPTLYHMKNLPKEFLLHFPWSVPDQFVNLNEIRSATQNYLMIFGAMNSEQYETRTWCKSFEFVRVSTNSGCRNKIFSDEDFFRWLINFDAMIAAGSLDPKYQLVVPKYFEIASVGSLLFAQEAKDLPLLGFKDNKNCITFNKANFEENAKEYLEYKNKDKYLIIRDAGRNLILQRHTLSKRLEFLKKHILDNL